MKKFNLKLNRRQKATAIVTAVALALFGLFSALLLMPASVSPKDSVEIVIENGQGLSSIADELKDLGTIRSKYVFMLYVMAIGQDDNVKAGRYMIDPNTNISSVVYVVTEGLSESDDVVVVIPEGYNIWEIDRRLTESGLNANNEFARKYYLRDGYFYPDTYRFKKGTSLDDIAQKMERNFVTKYGIPNSQIRIMASILEKEARAQEDMELIAGIILKRIHLGMNLQIDATVGYGWCTIRFIQLAFRNSCDVTQAPIALELKKDGEFNTYTREGFPPRPISNPGKVSLEAAKNPKVSDYLYYLTTREGQMIYSKTGAEHETNRIRYLGL